MKFTIAVLACLCILPLISANIWENTESAISNDIARIMSSARAQVEAVPLRIAPIRSGLAAKLASSIIHKLSADEPITRRTTRRPPSSREDRPIPQRKVPHFAGRVYQGLMAIRPLKEKEVKKVVHKIEFPTDTTIIDNTSTYFGDAPDQGVIKGFDAQYNGIMVEFERDQGAYIFADDFTTMIRLSAPGEPLEVLKLTTVDGHEYTGPWSKITPPTMPSGGGEDGGDEAMASDPTPRRQPTRPRVPSKTYSLPAQMGGRVYHGQVMLRPLHAPAPSNQLHEVKFLDNSRVTDNTPTYFGDKADVGQFQYDPSVNAIMIRYPRGQEAFFFSEDHTTMLSYAGPNQPQHLLKLVQVDGEAYSGPHREVKMPDLGGDDEGSDDESMGLIKNHLIEQ